MAKSILIGTADAAEELHVHRSTITRMVEAGKLKPKVRGRGIRGEMFFTRAEIDRVKNSVGARRSDNAEAVAR